MQARTADMPQPKMSKGARMLALTLLDGTTINLPADGEKQAGSAEKGEQQLTARDLVAALRAEAHGADASDILGDDVKWESMFAALLSVLLRKHLVADWEFIDELKKNR